MKTITIATLLLAVALSFGLMQNKCGGTKTKTVSAAVITKLPPGKSFEIDLTRNGTIYKFDEPDTDFSRVTVRTVGGLRIFADLLKESNTSLRRGLVLGTPSDMRNHLPTSKGGGTIHFDCGVICKCNDTNDCLDLILGGNCSTEFWCSRDTESCFCVAKP
jgi:hypothetical protein